MSDITIIALIAYLLGSIPFGVVLAKLVGLPDPRTIGSGNIGATNMLRTGNKKVALATLLLDAGKGVAAVLIAAQFSDAVVAQAVAVLFASVGHMFSPWLKFSGGKGVATILGGVFVLSPIVGGMFCVMWLVVFVPTRLVALASIVALMAVPVTALLVLGIAPAFVLALATSIAVFKHRGNIQRIVQGTEPKMQRSTNAD